MVAMDRIPLWRRYLRFWRNDPKRDVDEEVRFHLESLVEELVAGGVPREEARARAMARFGDVHDISRTLYDLSLHRERTMQHLERLDTLKQDVRFGLRQLRKNPAFTLVAVLTLALGIGANSAIFSVVYSVLLHPLPYANADRVLVLSERNGRDPMSVTFGNFDVWRREATGFAAMGGLWSLGPLTLTGHGDPTPIYRVNVSAGYWTAMYIPPVLGSYFTEADDQFGAPPVVVVSYALWRNRLSADPNIIGKMLTLSGTPCRVVAVAAPEYVAGPPTERVWTPLAPAPSRVNDHADHELAVYAVLKPGVTAKQALAQLTQIETGLAKDYPNSYFDGGILAKPLLDATVGSELRFRLYLLLGAVGLVLLIACGNVASLLIARATTRRTEIAIRGALGATRARIVNQLLVESVLLSVSGAIGGVLVAVAAMRFLRSSPLPIPRLQDAALNAPVLGFTFALAVTCGVVFGLLPALRAARLDLQQVLRDGGRESRGAMRQRFRRALVVSELCLAEVLLVSAGLLIRSAMALDAVPTGFDPHNLLAVSLNLPGKPRYPSPAQQAAAFEQIDRAIAAIPGVQSVGRTQTAPIYSGGTNWTAFREGSNGHDDGAAVTDMRSATPTFFATLRLPLLRGRNFTEADAANAAPVIIITRSTATRFFGNTDPIGRRLGDGWPPDPSKAVWREVVGVVDDLRANGKANDPPLTIYRPAAQWVNGGQTILVRGNVPVLSLLRFIRGAVASVDPLLAVSRPLTMEDAIARQQALPRFTSWLLTLLGATGLVLAALAVYGLIGYVVTQRTHELGVRMALGASDRAVQWMVVRQGVALGIAGVMLGSLVALYAARLLQAMLFGVSTHDVPTFAAVAVVLLVVGLVASYVPARRATRIDPLEAVRGG